MEREIRYLPACELRVEDADGPKIRGYAAVFNKKSEDLGGFREIVAPGAFKESLDRGDDVRALVEHDPGRIIGRRSAGTLTLEEDGRGLKVEIVPPDTSVGRDIVESIRRGDVTQMSFGFRTVIDEWDESGKTVLRTLRQADVFDVSPVSFPAYPQTKVAVRSMEQWRASQSDADRGKTGSNRNRLRLAKATAIG